MKTYIPIKGMIVCARDTGAYIEKTDYDAVKAELAAEREKVRMLRKALGNVKNSICRNVPDGYSQPCVDESADECDRIIDAAMKEDGK